jgi:hypothetical protein
VFKGLCKAEEGPNIIFQKRAMAGEQSFPLGFTSSCEGGRDGKDWTDQAMNPKLWREPTEG